MGRCLDQRGHLLQHKFCYCTSFVSLNQDLLTKKENSGKDIVITNVTMIQEIQKVRKG